MADKNDHIHQLKKAMPFTKASQQWSSSLHRSNTVIFKHNLGVDCETLHP